MMDANLRLTCFVFELLPELLRSQVIVFFENPVEIGRVAVTAVIGDQLY